MDTLVRPDASSAEPRLLLEWPAGQYRVTSWAGSLLAHAAVLIVLTVVPGNVVRHASQPAHSVTPLVAPPRIMTQTAPNRGPIGREFTIESLTPRPRIFVPPGAPASRRAAGRAPMPAPAPVPEPPKLEASNPVMAQGPPPTGASATEAPPPPQIQTEEKPKLAFETPGAPRAPRQPRGLGPPPVQAPSGSISEAVRGALRSSSGSTAVGDVDLSGPGGLGPGLNLPSMPGPARSQLEMLSDPMGIDFRPYLIRVLAAVKRNWMAVIPESARLGRQGRVQIQFAVARDGSVPKLVIALASGTDALDRAAVAGVSASTPFPPLPNEFRGNQVRLQLTFLYNMK